MATQKKSFIIYKRDKNKVEISGDPENVKWPIWFDMVSSLLRWLIPITILLILIPKENFLPILMKMKWIKNLFPFVILFVIVVDYAQILLSG